MQAFRKFPREKPNEFNQTFQKIHGMHIIIQLLNALKIHIYYY